MDGLTQFVAAPGVMDLGWGHPDPDLLPVAELRTAAARALDRYGADALAYGNSAGPPPLREFISARLQETDARAPATGEILITGGTSQGLDLVATLFMRPGDVVLADEPTYYLALRILADHRLDLRGVRSDAQGIDLEDLARVVGGLPRGPARAARSTEAQRPGRRLFLYTIPTFNNPTGTSLSDERRAALVAFAAEQDLLVIEDDTYRELAYDGPVPASLWALAPPGVVIRLGSFAKSVAPGLRTGYLTADGATVDRMAGSGFLDSGGSPSQFSALVLAEYAAAGDYLRGVEHFRAAYRERRDRLLAALALQLGESAQPGESAHLGETATWSRPRGGYFVWVSLPKGVTPEGLAEPALRAGIGFMPARVCFVDPRRAPAAVRLAFSRYPPEALEEATARLAAAIRETRRPPESGADDRTHRPRPAADSDDDVRVTQRIAPRPSGRLS